MGEPADPAAPLVVDRRGAGPAVVLLHGQPGTAAVWDPVVLGLDPDATTLAVDRPGYGRTGGAAVGFGANATAVAGLLADTGPAVVVGHSWGGGVALALAAARPDLVAGLVLVASISPTAPPSRLDRLLTRPLLGGGAARLSVGLSGRVLTSKSSRRWLLPHIPGPGGRYLRTLPDGPGPWRSWLDEQRSYVRDIRALAPGLGHLDRPTVVVHGGRDRTVPLAQAEALAAAIPAARLVRLPGAGHLLPLEAPEAVADAVRSLLPPRADPAGAPGRWTTGPDR